MAKEKSDSTQQPERRTAEAWAEDRGTPAWLLSATRAGRRWAIGRELTADEYDSAVNETATIPIGATK